MSLKYYALNDHCGSKPISKFVASEEQFDSIDECCRAKFPQSVSDCCEAGSCTLSGNLKFIPVSYYL
jgi:hypothetical protein